MPNSLPGRGTAYALSCTLALLSCTRPQAVVPAPKSPTATNPEALPAATEDETLLAVSKGLRSHRLLARPDQCYAYRFDPAPGQPAAVVDVQENHGHVECGGDPQTQPHLFTVRMDKTTHALSADVRSPGIFEPLQP